MKSVFSNHAKKRLKERNIKGSEVSEVINFPEYTLKRGGEIEAYKKINGKTLKVVYIRKENYIKVITVYPLG